MKAWCIADEDTVRGMRLAGIEGCTVTTPQQAGAALNTVILRPEYCLIILTERVAASIPDQVEQVRFHRERPLIVTIPGPEGSPSGHRDLRSLVKEAIGIKIENA